MILYPIHDTMLKNANTTHVYYMFDEDDYEIITK